MSIFPIIAAAVLSGIGSDEYLGKNEAEALGILISAQELEASYDTPAVPVNFRLDISGILNCEVANVWVDIIDDEGYPAFGTSIKERSGNYSFYVPPAYLDYSSVIISCSEGPNIPDKDIFLGLGAIWMAP